MYKKIVVPLDGSALAECVLPHVEEIAQGDEGPEVIFLSVIRRSDLDYHALTNEKRKRAIKYLELKVKDAEEKGLNANAEIMVGDPAERILDYAADKGADLIVMATHGRSGISRWAHGSVADKVLRNSSVPVTMIRAVGGVSDMKSEKETATTINVRKSRLLRCK